MPSATTRALAAVSELAAGQWGLFTTAQASMAGVSRVQLARLTNAAVLERVDQGVYASTSSPTEYRTLRAAWLSLDPNRTAEERLADPVNAGVASHTSAAGLHRLGDLLDDSPEFTVPHRKQSRRSIRLHRLPLTPPDVTLVDGLPTTTEERTVADLLRDGRDPDHVAQIIGQGIRRAVIDPSVLAGHLDPLARRHGQADGRALLEHLLDLAGLSPASLARELTNTAAGEGLVAVGRAQALGDLMASLVPQIDAAKVIEMEKLAADFTRIDTSTIMEVSRALRPLQAEFAKAVRAMEVWSDLGLTRSDVVAQAMAAAAFPAGRAAQQRLGSSAGGAAAGTDARRDDAQSAR